MEQEEKVKLFVYGTLRKGCRANDLMDGASFLGFGKTKAKLVYIDRYPGLLRSETEWTMGEVYEVGVEHLKQLDRYEGCNEDPAHYLRDSFDVTMDSGARVNAQCYVFQLYEAESNPPVMDNDWLAYMKKCPELNSFES